MIPKVSICCITFNHENYIRDSIEGFLMQKTSFPIEILLHDDASTDKTANIIREYEAKYPDIIKPIYQTENQYSKGTSISSTYQLPRARGKYIALCEGDDYWTDPLKLQKQVDILENNQDYVMCFTNRTKIDTEGDIINEDTISGRFKRDLMPQEVIGSFTPPTQTVVFRHDLLDSNILNSPHKIFNGDTFWFWYIAQFGKTAYLDENTAAYRVSGEGVYSSMNTINRLEKRLNTIRSLERVIRPQFVNTLKSSKDVIYQRLFVLYFLSGKKLNAVRIYKQILNRSLVVSIRAIKLLFTSKFFKVKITD